MSRPSRAWAEISLENIAHNADRVREIVGPDTKLMCVVKADAYGHGVEGVVPVLIGHGADILAVASLDEGIQLRKMGVGIPVLILGYTDPERACEVVEYGLSQTVFSYELGKALSQAASAKNSIATIHIKTDTGMGRFGIIPGQGDIELISDLCKLPGINAEGIYTHFADADSDDAAYTEEQFLKFTDLVSRLESNGIRFKLKHACNSAAILKFPHMHMDMVRPGIILYGISPSKEIDVISKGFKPVMSLVSTVAMVKTIKAGSYVSYGRTYEAKTEKRVATISIGYADGYLRALSNCGEVLIKGFRYKIAGTICMDACVVDISGPDRSIDQGDDVVLIGSSGEDEISIDEVAAHLGSISYEVVCTIGRRVPRVFVDGNGNRKVRNMLLDNGVTATAQSIKAN